MSGLNCQRQTDRQTNGHRNSMTNLAQWANSVKSCALLTEAVANAGNFVLLRRKGIFDEM